MTAGNRRPAPALIHVRRILGLSLIHFVIAMLIGIVAFGADFDQLASRTQLSRGAAAVHNFLWWPHDAVVRSIPNAWLIRNRYIIPVLIVANSLVWGAVIYGLGRAAVSLRRSRR